MLDVVEPFFGRRRGSAATLLSAWPTPDLSHRGWSLVGHPVLVVRAPGPVRQGPRAGVDVRVAASAGDFRTVERVAVEGFPLDEARGLSPGRLFPPRLAGTGLVVHLGLLAGEPAGVGNVFFAHGLVNLCLAATLPQAVAYTSDTSRPGFVRLGFLPITRFTLWSR